MTGRRRRVVWHSLVTGALALVSTLGLTCRKPNAAPGSPAAPDGPSWGAVDSVYLFAGTASDPDGDDVCYRFDWGDGDTSDWTALVRSGQPGVVSHSWRVRGAYVVRAQAKDAGDSVSAWSDGHQLSVALAWARSYGGTEPAYGASVQPTSDGGYIVVGHQFYHSTNDVWLVKTDSSGNKTWDKSFGGSEDDKGKSVQQTADGGYIITGHTYSYSGGLVNVWLIKTDEQGNKTWDKALEESGTDFGNSVQQTPDGGYIITGYAYPDSSSYPDALLIKTSASGDKVWSRTFGGPGHEYGYSVQPTADGGYVVVGATASDGKGDENVWLVKTDSSGSLVWDKTLGGTGADLGASVRQTSDGGYIIAGYTYSYGAGNGDVWLVKTDEQGNKVWDKTFGGSEPEQGTSVGETPDGGYIITGYTASSGAGSSDVWLVKTDEQGNKVWDKSYGGAEAELGASVQPTADGGYIVGGTTYAKGGGDPDFWLVKTGANGECPASSDTTGH